MSRATVGHLREISGDHKEDLKITFKGRLMMFSSDKDGDYYKLDCSRIKSVKIIYNDDADNTLEIELG
jgi:hypothetical protein